MKNYYFKILMCYLAAILIILIFKNSITIYMSIATINYFSMLAGFLIRKQNNVSHIKLMSFCMVSDLILVLILEFQRHAIEKAASFTLNPIQQLHILHSTIALLCYFFVIWFGIKLKTQSKFRIPHRRLGYTTFYFRTVGFILMFSMLK